MFNWFLLFPWARTDSWQGGFSSTVIVVVTIVTFVGLCWNPGMEGALDLKSPALKQVGRVSGYLHPLMHWLVSLFYVESLGYSPNNQGVVPQCRRGLLIGRSLSPLHTSSHHVQNLRQNFTDFSFSSFKITTRPQIITSFHVMVMVWVGEPERWSFVKINDKPCPWTDPQQVCCLEQRCSRTPWK